MSKVDKRHFFRGANYESALRQQKHQLIHEAHAEHQRLHNANAAIIHEKAVLAAEQHLIREEKSCLVSEKAAIAAEKQAVAERSDVVADVITTTSVAIVEEQVQEDDEEVVEEEHVYTFKELDDIDAKVSAAAAGHKPQPLPVGSPQLLDDAKAEYEEFVSMPALASDQSNAVVAVAPGGKKNHGLARKNHRRGPPKKASPSKRGKKHVMQKKVTQQIVTRSQRRFDDTMDTN